jgi:hypothetical protein
MSESGQDGPFPDEDAEPWSIEAAAMQVLIAREAAVGAEFVFRQLAAARAGDGTAAGDAGLDVVMAQLAGDAGDVDDALARLAEVRAALADVARIISLCRLRADHGELQAEAGLLRGLLAAAVAGESR